MIFKKIINKSFLFYTLYIIAALVFFLWYLFPSDYFADYLEKTIAANGNGITAEIGSVKPSFPAGAILKNVIVSHSELGSVKIDYAKAGIGIASLLKLNPEVYFRLGLFGGTVNGKAGAPDGDSGQLLLDDIIIDGIDAGKVSALFKENLFGFTVSGSLSANGNYTTEKRGSGYMKAVLKGLRIRREEPFFTIDSMTFDEINAEAEISNRRLKIKSVTVSGREFDCSLKGSVVLKQPVDKTVLRLNGSFSPSKEFSEKVPLDVVFRKKVVPGEDLSFRVTGTVGKPKIK